jgi:RNA polymerase sigma factor (TIGR02999 family)
MLGQPWTNTRPMPQPTDSASSKEPEAPRNTDRRPVDALFEQVYAELKGLAHRVRGGREGVTLDTTALVHEAYIKLASSRQTPWKNDAHFFAIAARAMRQVLVDAARHRMAQKRAVREPLLLSYDDGAHAAPVRPEELIELDEALERLSRFDPRRAQVVEHRMFAGLTTEETARLLNVSTATVERDWRTARAWLTAELRDAKARMP